MNNYSTDFILTKANSFAKKGRISEASQLYRSIIKKFPQNKLAKDGLINAHDYLAIVYKKELLFLYNNGNLDLVIKKALPLTCELTHSVFIWNILGSSYLAQEKFDKAIENFEQILKIKPDIPEVYNNIGIAFSNYNKPHKAIESYKQAIKIKPKYADAFNNMGAALAENGNLEKAIESYKLAIQIKPDYTDAYNNMGIAFNNLGNIEKAFDCHEEALTFDPESATTLIYLVNLIRKMSVNKPCQKKLNLLLSVLKKDTYVRPSSISKVSIELLKLEPNIKTFFEKYYSGDLKNLLHKVILDLSKIPLLTKLMSICPLVDIEFENVLTSTRRFLLFSINEEKFSIQSLKFLSALALQCFTNEYIYICDEKEMDAIKSLEISIEKTFISGKQPSPEAILCLATYKALYEYEWCHLITKTDHFEEVFRRQFLEPMEENYLSKDIRLLEKVTNKISNNVRKQYEENPYPRWVNLSLSQKPATISKFINQLKLKIFNSEIYRVKIPQILIAGCGTGQQSIEKKSHFHNCKMLAIDLSLSSLAYAKRKTKELNIKNIDYVQSDILDLYKLETQFHIVESVGVLHHMEDPMAGWRILVDCLKPGGLIKIGLYSEMARRSVVNLRKKINYLCLPQNDFSMKLFRQDLINSNENEFNEIRIANDFYSLSMLRDLLFHIKEHRFNIRQIQNCLSELDLKFCGFEGNDIIKHFKLTNTDADDVYNLDKWNIYEEKNPLSFIGMYQFWCQKT